MSSLSLRCVKKTIHEAPSLLLLLSLSLSLFVSLSLSLVLCVLVHICAYVLHLRTALQFAHYIELLVFASRGDRGKYTNIFVYILPLPTIISRVAYFFEQVATISKAPNFL